MAQIAQNLSATHHTNTESICIYIISLASCTTRREMMQAQCDSLIQKASLDSSAPKLHMRFFDAINFSESSYPHLSSHIHPMLNRICWGRELSIGELGCFASHYSLWHKCLESSAPIIVLEDDVVLEVHFLEALGAIMASDFEYVRLYGIFKVDSKQIMPHFYATAQNISGAQGYYLTPQAASKLIKYAKQWIMPVDDYMDSFYIHKVRNIFYSPYLIKENNLESTISGRTKQPFSIYKITREIYRLYRQMRKNMYCLAHGF